MKFDINCEYCGHGFCIDHDPCKNLQCVCDYCLTRWEKIKKIPVIDFTKWKKKRIEKKLQIGNKINNKNDDDDS